MKLCTFSRQGFSKKYSKCQIIIDLPNLQQLIHSLMRRKEDGEGSATFFLGLFIAGGRRDERGREGGTGWLTNGRTEADGGAGANDYGGGRWRRWRRRRRRWKTCEELKPRKRNTLRPVGPLAIWLRLRDLARLSDSIHNKRLVEIVRSFGQRIGSGKVNL